MSVSVCMRRLLRLAFCERADRLCCLKPGPAFTLPVAVILNRFLTDDLVFILGIWFSFSLRPTASAGGRGRACPFQARTRDLRGGCIAARQGRRKRAGATAR